MIERIRSNRRKRKIETRIDKEVQERRRRKEKSRRKK